ncbi:unnamed protein product, partial [Brassica rapa subsp. narinosa]
VNLCVLAGNLEAHYLRGMQEYFQNENITDGGDPDIGKPLLDSLGWRENKARSDACWQSIKTSLHGVRVKRFEIYITIYRATRPTINCHRNDIAIRCETCYYFKQMKKFVFII